MEKMKPTKITCEICNIVITQMVNYLQHKAAHIGVKPFYCNICLKSFLSEPNYCAHLSYHCEGVAETKLFKKEYVCHICETVCTSYGNLAKHYLDHLVRMDIFCEKCKLYFNDENDYAIHQHLHQKDKVCKICGCDFLRKSEMLKHVQSHYPNKYFSNFNQAAYVKKRLRENISQDLKILSGKSDDNLSKPGKHHVKFTKSSKMLKISPSLFGQKFSAKSSAALGKNKSKKCNIKISTEKKKNRKENADLSHKQEENVTKRTTPVKKFSTSVVNCTLLVNPSLEKLQKNSKNLPNKEFQQSITLLHPNYKSPIVKKSSVVSCTMNDKVDAKIINNNSLANSPSKNHIKCKSVLSKKSVLIEKSHKRPSPPINESVYGLKQCSVLLNKFPFFVQDYESYLLYMKSSKYRMEKHLNVSVDYILKCLKHLEDVFQDDVKTLSILRHVKNIYENQKSVIAEKKLNFFLFELCTLYYNKTLKDVPNSKSLQYKNNSDLYKNSALSDSEDIKETLFTLKRRIQNIQKTLNIINTTKQVKNIKHLKILLRRLPDDIFKKYVRKKPIMLSTVMPIIC